MVWRGKMTRLWAAAIGFLIAGNAEAQDPQAAWGRTEPPGWAQWSKEEQTTYQRRLAAAEKDLGNPPAWARSLLVQSCNTGFDVRPSFDVVKACLDAALDEKRSTAIVKTLAVNANRVISDDSGLAHWVIERLKDVSEEEIRKEIKRLNQIPWKLVFSTNKAVSSQDAEKVEGSVRKKWLADRNVETLSQATFYDNMAKYAQNRILTVDVQHSFGEFFFNVRSTEVLKRGDDYDEYPRSWIPINQARAETLESLLKKIEQLP